MTQDLQAGKLELVYQLICLAKKKKSFQLVTNMANANQNVS